MLTLADIRNQIFKIREAIDGVEVKGHENRSLASYAYQLCNDLIEALNETAHEIQNRVQEAGEDDGEPDSGTAE